MLMINHVFNYYFQTFNFTRQQINIPFLEALLMERIVNINAITICQSFVLFVLFFVSLTFDFVLGRFVKIRDLNLLSFSTKT